MNHLTLSAIGLSALIAGVTFPREEAAAQMAKDVVGSWTIVSATNERNGQKYEPYGPNPIGSLMLDGRRFSIIILRSNRPKFASNDREKGTPEENQATVHGSIAYFGTYTVNEADKTLLLHVEGSTFPNWEGADQKRLITAVGDELRYTNPTPSGGGGGTAQLVWKRAK